MKNVITVTKALQDGRDTTIRVDAHGTSPASVTVHIMQPAQTDITTAPSASVTLWPLNMAGAVPTDMLAHLIEALQACQSAIKMRGHQHEADNDTTGVPDTT